MDVFVCVWARARVHACVCVYTHMRGIIMKGTYIIICNNSDETNYCTDDCTYLCACMQVCVYVCVCVCVCVCERCVHTNAWYNYERYI